VQSKRCVTSPEDHPESNLKSTEVLSQLRNSLLLCRIPVCIDTVLNHGEGTAKGKDLAIRQTMIIVYGLLHCAVQDAMSFNW
jgi:hypothetical protein